MSSGFSCQRPGGLCQASSALRESAAAPKRPSSTITVETKTSRGATTNTGRQQAKNDATTSSDESARVPRTRPRRAKRQARPMSTGRPATASTAPTCRAMPATKSSAIWARKIPMYPGLRKASGWVARLAVRLENQTAWQAATTEEMTATGIATAG